MDWLTNYCFGNNPLFVSADSKNRKVHHLNSHLFCHTNADEQDQQSSRASTPDFVIEFDLFRLPFDRETRKYVFGAQGAQEDTRHGIDFAVPKGKDGGNASINHMVVHPKINGVFMVEDTSKNGTLVNGAWVFSHRAKKAQLRRIKDEVAREIIEDYPVETALHPEKPNTVRIGTTELSLLITGNEWTSSGHDLHKPTGSHLHFDRLEVGSEPSTIVQTHISDQDDESSYHILEKSIPSGQGRIRKLIVKRTGQFMVGKFYNPQQKAAAEETYNLLRDLFQVRLPEIMMQG